MVDAGTIYSEVRVALSKLEGDVKEVISNFDKISGESKKMSDQVGQGSEAQKKKLDTLKSAYENVGVAVTAALAFSKKLIDSWADAEQAAVRLDAAVRLSGGSFGESKNLIDYADQLQKTSGFEDELIKNLIAQAELMGRTEDQAKELALAATQLANSGVMGLDEAFTQLAVTYDGMAPRSKVLKALTGDLSEAQLRGGKAVDEIAKKTAGMNEVMMNTTAGGLKSIKNAFGELQESAGRVLSILAGPAFKPFADVVNKLADLVNKTVELREAQVAYANGTANLNQQLLVSKEKYAAIIEALNGYADMQNKGIGLTKEQETAYLNLQKRMKEWGAAIVDIQNKSKEEERIAAKRKAEAAEREKAAAEFIAQEQAKRKAIADSIDAEDERVKRYAAALKAEFEAKKDHDAEIKDAKEKERAAAQAYQMAEIEAEVAKNQQIADNHDLLIAQLTKQYAFLTDTITSSMRDIFGDIGKSLAEGTLSWKSFGESVIHVIGKIVTSLGDQLAADAAKALIEAIAASLNPFTWWAAPEMFASAAVLAGGVAAAYLAGGLLENISLATGGIVLPRNGGTLARMAENGAPELALNGGPEGRAFLDQFADRIARAMGRSGGPVQIFLDGKVIAESSARYFNKGITRLDR